MKRLTQTRPGSGPARSGATVVEMGVVLPAFLLMIFAFVEFGHAYMVIHVLNSAAKKAARYGIGDNATTAQVRAKAEEIVSGLLPAHNFTINIKDGSAYDDPGVDASGIDFASLPNATLEDADSRTLFIVRVEVPYNNIAILGPTWASDLQLYGPSVLRKD